MVEPKDGRSQAAWSEKAPQHLGPARGEVRILHVVGDSKYGGGALLIRLLAEKTRGMGWPTDVLTTDPIFQRELRHHGIRVVDLDVIWRPINPPADLWGLWKLYRFLRRAGYTVVHTHTSKAGFVGRFAARAAGVPVVVHTAHGFAFHEASSCPTIWLYSWLEQLAARCCDRVVTVSDFHRRWALALGISTPEKVIAIPNGIPESRVHPTRPREEVRGELGLAPGDFVILSTGRLAPQKGLDLILSVIPHLVARLDCSFKVLFAGDGPIKPTLQQMARELSITDRVHFLGFRDDIGNLLAASDLVVLPTLREGLSIALLEAMAAGKAVLTTTIGSNREVLEASEAGWLVPPGDPNRLAEGIERLAREDSLRRSLGERAKKLYRERYTEEQMLNLYLAEYVKLCEERSLQATVFAAR